MLKSPLIIAGITLLPLLELRAAIPYGIINNEIHWIGVFLTAVTVNILLGALLYKIVDKVVHFFFIFKPFEKWYKYKLARTQRRVEKTVHKYGPIGLGLFIAIPLPGSGVYTGTLAAYALGMDFKDYMKAVVFGVIMAGMLVTLITLTGIETFSWAIKTI